MIRRKKLANNHEERQIIIGMITSKEFLKGIIPLFNRSFLTQDFVGTVADWCIEYFNEFGDPPQSQIQDLFASKKDTLTDDDVETIAQFLSSISDEYEHTKFNVRYHLKKAERYFRRQALRGLKDTLSESLLSDDIDEAEDTVATFRRVTMPQTQGVNVFYDKKAIIDALSPDNEEILFSLPKALGQALGPFSRNTFCMIVGAMGAGKSWMLQDIAIRAAFSGCNVLFVSLEMSQNQMIRRFMRQITKTLPMWESKKKVLIPQFDCMKNQKKICSRSKAIKDVSELPIKERPNVEHRVCLDCAFKKHSDFELTTWHTSQTAYPLTSGKALSKGRALKQLLRGSLIKMINPPPMSVSMKDIETMLNNLEFYEGWIPDVIITDYLDKFLPSHSASSEGYRHKLYDIVLSHKSLASSRNCCVISASQSNTSRKDGAEIKPGDFAEDIRKKAEVDAAWSIYQTPRQKEEGLLISSVMKLRDRGFNPNRKIYILQQLEIAQPNITSF